MTKYDFSRMKQLVEDINSCEKIIANLEHAQRINISNTMNNDVIGASLGENRELFEILVPIIKKYYEDRFIEKSNEFEVIKVKGNNW